MIYTITIGNLRDYTTRKALNNQELFGYKLMESKQIIVRVDRKSVLGNPFFMKDESERDKVCDQYREYFWKNFREPEKWAELSRLLTIARQRPLMLACWCYPKRCHAPVIKCCLEWMDISMKDGEVPEPPIMTTMVY